jgi:hypothetical protein
MLKTVIARTWLLTLACALAAATPAGAARHYPPGVKVPGGPGRIVPVLSDGTIREPSVDRAESVDGIDTLATHAVDWDVTLAGFSTDRMGTLDKQSVMLGHASATYGLGGGGAVSVRAETWERTRLDAPGGAGTIEASGLGATTVGASKTWRPPGFGVRLGAFARIPGAAGGPDTRQDEWGGSLGVGRTLGDRTTIVAAIVPAWVGNVQDSGHHFEAAAGLAGFEEASDHVSLWLEVVSVSSDETQRPWLGVLDAGVRLDAASHLGLTLGGSAGRGGGRNDAGVFASVGVHS